MNNLSNREISVGLRQVIERPVGVHPSKLVLMSLIEDALALMRARATIVNGETNHQLDYALAIGSHQARIDKAIRDIIDLAPLQERP